MATKQILHSDLPIPPGEYLAEVLDDLGMTKDELAKRMIRPAAKLSAIFKGDKVITADTALQLEKVIGVPAHIWTGLEAEYRLTLARRLQVKEQERVKAEIPLVTRFKYAELAKIGVVAKTTRPDEKVHELQKFFGVASLNTVKELRRYQPFLRKGRNASSKSPEAMAAWLRIGELSAQKCACSTYKEGNLNTALSTIRAMTLQPPNQFREVLHRVLADAGVALVICPHLPGTGLHGATFWIGKDKAVVMMTLRNKWADIFWFSLFHEIGHILLHGTQTVILEYSDGDPNLEKLEGEANRFAADTLIAPKDYEHFFAEKKFYSDDIQRFAARVGIDVGIVVGRLQHDKVIDSSWHNRLRKRFDWEKR